MNIKLLKQWFSPLLTLLMYVGIVLILATTLSFVFKVDQYFWTMTAIGVIIMVITNLIWIPTGVDKGAEAEKVKKNTAIYNNRANYIVNNQMFTLVKEFCDYKNAQFKKELITALLASVTLDYWVYEYYVAHDLEEGQATKLESAIRKATPKQIKMLERLKTKEVSFEKLQPKHITIGKTGKAKNVPQNREKTYKNVLLAGKFIWGIAMGCFAAFIVIYPSGGFGMAQIIQIIVWGFSIAYNIYAAITAGYKSVTVYRNDFMIEQAELCAEFFSFIGINVKEVDG